jgi:hypothetical protein
LRRINLFEINKRNDLRICDGHNLELCLIEYPWTGVKYNQEYDKAYFKLPMDPDDPPLEPENIIPRRGNSRRRGITY